MNEKDGIIEIIIDGKTIPVKVKVVEQYGFITYILPPYSVPCSISYPIGHSPIRLKEINEGVSG